jgi:SAM-dependent methyltransferase
VNGVTLRHAFARDAGTAAYYEKRAREYDDWYTGEGRFASRERPGWRDEVIRLVEFVAALPSARTLDIACGSGFLTRHLAGFVVGLDQSPAMVALAQSRLPGGVAMTGDALDLPFAAGAFNRVITGHFYGHLPEDEREIFLAEARRVAPELIVIDSAQRPGLPASRVEERVLNDGSRHHVYKRFLSSELLAQEIGGEVLFTGTWFVVARSVQV